MSHDFSYKKQTVKIYKKIWFLKHLSFQNWSSTFIIAYHVDHLAKYKYSSLNTPGKVCWCFKTIKRLQCILHYILRRLLLKPCFFPFCEYLQYNYLFAGDWFCFVFVVFEENVIHTFKVSTENAFV